MNYSKLFTVKTTMAKEDYRKFLYISTFLKSKMMTIFMIFFTAFISGLIFYSENQFDLIGFIYYWIILMILVILVTILKIEIKFRRIIKTDKTGSLDSQEVLDFYEDFLIVKSKVFEGEIKVKYAQFYEVFESKDYFITYFNANKATLIRKKDMESEVIHSLRSLYKQNLTNKYKKVNI
ncbi:hypothetical protein SDC9_129104 [bioreactor metagenome]|uniref:YcxB-like C-terminal domain-containing protein n=1 Tax=bioreactor metagenome TaxID=1076179 RepID=A0A645CY16_9ZZZZ